MSILSATSGRPQQSQAYSIHSRTSVSVMTVALIVSNLPWWGIGSGSVGRTLKHTRATAKVKWNSGNSFDHYIGAESRSGCDDYDD
jgi:hypothetical protein